MAGGIFEQQDIAAPQGGISPQQAVAPAPASTANVVGSVAQGVGQLFSAGIQMYANQAAVAKKQQQDKLVGGFATTITNLNAAVEQGTIKQADAQRMQRAEFNKLVAARPDLTDDLVKLNTSIANSAGLGTTLANGTAVDQQIQADTKAATGAGFIQPGMTPSQQENGLNLYRQQQHALNQMDFASKQLGLQNQQLSLVEKRANIANAQVQRANALQDLNQKRNKQAVQNGLADFSNVYAQDTISKIGTLNEQLAQKQITPEQYLQATQAMRTKFYSVTQSARGVAGGDYIDTLSSPLFKMLDAADAQASGKVSLGIAQNQLDHASVTAQLDFMKDPKIAGIAAQSKLFNGIFNPVVLSRYGADVVKVLHKNSTTGTPANAVPDDPDEMETNKTYFDGLKEGIQTLTGKSPLATDPKGLQQELETNLNQILKSVGVMGASSQSPTQFNDVMKFIADPNFLAFQQHGGMIDPALAQNAKQVIQENYEAQLVPAIQKEWEQAKAITAKSRVGAPVPVMGGIGGGYPSSEDASSAVKYTWNGKSLQFVPSPGNERNRGALAKAKELNQKVSPLVQRLVMAAAHLDGNTDYGKYFKDLEPAMFGATETKTDGQ